ncbi:MAG: UbiA family prenyltransferase [Candidatus Heimdallarchaeaceae archaeon]
MVVKNYSKGEIVLSYITILRLLNGIVAGTAAAFAIVLSTPVGSQIDFFTLTLVLLASTLVSSQAMIFNDIADRVEDSVNAPHRPLPSGKISVRIAVIYGGIIAILAIGAALWIDLREGLPGLSIATAVIFGSSLNLYNFKFKKMGFWGNLLIGFNVVALFVYGSLFSLFVYNEDFTWVPVIVGIAAALGNIGREVIKGLPDIEGDRKAGNKTLAVRFGPRITAIIASLFLAGLAGGAILAMFLADLYLPSLIVAIVLAVIVTFLIIAININQSSKCAYITKEILLVVFLVFLLDFIIDRIVKLAIG